MTGHFMLIGTPEDLNFNSYGENGEKELAEWKFGYARFKSFSTTVIATLREHKGVVRVAGNVREKQGTGNHAGRIFDEWIVSACEPMKPKSNTPTTKQEQPADNSGLPF